MRDAKLTIEEGESRTASLEQELKDAEQRFSSTTLISDKSLLIFTSYTNSMNIVM